MRSIHAEVKAQTFCNNTLNDCALYTCRGQRSNILLLMVIVHCIHVEIKGQSLCIEVKKIFLPRIRVLPSETDQSSA